MIECYYACKQIVQLCEEARMKGKKVIRINKIEDIADEAIRADDSALSNISLSDLENLPTLNTAQAIWTAKLRMYLMTTGKTVM